MDSDEVNSYDDTVESVQVANLLKYCFYDCAVDMNLHEHEDLIQLSPSLDNTKPCLMTLPTNVTRVDWIKYDNQTTEETSVNYQDVCYLPLKDFIEMTNQLANSDAGNTDSMTVEDTDGLSYTFYFQNDRAPQYYTHFGNNTLIFDAFDETVDSTLQGSKTQCFGAKYPGWTMSNNFIPDLDPTQFPYLLNKAKTRAFMELKQTPNPESGGEARRQKIVDQKRKRRLTLGSEFDRLPKYGRTGAMYSKIIFGR